MHRSRPPRPSRRRQTVAVAVAGLVLSTVPLESAFASTTHSPSARATSSAQAREAALQAFRQRLIATLHPSYPQLAASAATAGEEGHGAVARSGAARATTRPAPGLPPLDARVFRFLPDPAPGTTSSSALAVNARGTAVGYARTEDDRDQATRWDPQGRATLLDEGVSSYAFAVRSDGAAGGQIVDRAVIWDAAGTAHLLPTPGPGFSSVSLFGDDGTAGGVWQGERVVDPDTGDTTYGPMHVVLWRPTGELVDLGSPVPTGAWTVAFVDGHALVVTGDDQGRGTLYRRDGDRWTEILSPPAPYYGQGVTQVKQLADGLVQIVYLVRGVDNPDGSSHVVQLIRWYDASGLRPTGWKPPGVHAFTAFGDFTADGATVIVPTVLSPAGATRLEEPVTGTASAAGIDTAGRVFGVVDTLDGRIRAVRWDPPSGTRQTTRAGVVEDTYVNSRLPRVGYPTTSSLAAGNVVSGDRLVEYRTFVKFRVPAAPAGKHLVRARLRLRTTPRSYSGTANRVPVRLLPAGTAWKATNLSYATAPQGPFALTGQVGPVAADSDSTTWLDPAAVTPGADVSLVLDQGDGGRDGVWVWSANYARTAYRPALELIWE